MENIVHETAGALPEPKHIAPLEFGEVRQFLIERSALGVRLLEPIAIWVDREPTPRREYFCTSGCQIVYGVTPESENYLERFCPTRAKRAGRTLAQARFYICPCMGRFVV